MITCLISLLIIEIHVKSEYNLTENYLTLFAMDFRTLIQKCETEMLNLYC
jgi:hypothetical protein